MIDIGIVWDTTVVYALSVTGDVEEVATSQALPRERGLMMALARAQGNPQARAALLTALGNPTPHEAFPALARSGNRPPRAQAKE